MEIILKVLASIAITTATALITKGFKFLSKKIEQIDWEEARKGQEDVFDWALKIVQAIEEEFRKSKEPKERISRLKHDQAVSRLNDVLMINKINPKLYNTEGIILYAVNEARRREAKQGGD